MTYRGPASYDPDHEAAVADDDERDRLADAAPAEARTVPGRWEVCEVALPTRYESARVWLAWHYAEDLDGIVVLHRDGMWRAVEPSGVIDWSTPRQALVDAAIILSADYPDDARAALAVLEAP